MRGVCRTSTNEPLFKDGNESDRTLPARGAGTEADAGGFAEENKVSDMAIDLELPVGIANERPDATATALLGDVIELQHDA